jgi:hypothetical protein
MRWPVYVWGDGHKTHLWPRLDQEKHAYTSPAVEDIDGYPGFGPGIAIADKLFDEIVVIRYAQIVREGRLAKTLKRIHKKGSGNFGTWEVFEAMGDDPAEDFRRKATEARAARRALGDTTGRDA